MKLYTYLVWTPEARKNGYPDEIDVRASTSAAAAAQARVAAAELYGPDFDLEEIKAGGSGGLAARVSF
jgi:hypothetical protein